VVTQEKILTYGRTIFDRVTLLIRELWSDLASQIRICEEVAMHTSRDRKYRPYSKLFPCFPTARLAANDLNAQVRRPSVTCVRLAFPRNARGIAARRAR